MALSLGKLTILIGAGFVGSVMAKEGRLPDVSGLVSGAFKVVLRQLQSNDSAPAVKKPHNDALIAQVNSLRQELQLLASDRSITIVNATGAGGKTYVTVIIVGAGCGFLWWKGWLPNMMFATRRALSEATAAIGIQLGKVYGSIEDAKSEVSEKINEVEKIADEYTSITESTKEDVKVIKVETENFSEVVIGVQTQLRRFESSMRELEERQIDASKKVTGIVRFTELLENGTTPEYIQGPSSMPALEPPLVSPSSRIAQSGPSRLYLEQPSITPISSSRTGSLPPARSAEPPTPSNTIVSNQETSRIPEERNLSSTRVSSMKTPPTVNNGSSSGGFFGLNLSGIYGPLLTRTRSATDAVKQEARPSS